MRVIYQRVTRAAVTADGNPCGAIGKGAMLLVGIAQGDTPDDAAALAKKAVELRVFEDENGRMNRSLADIGGEILAVSNFTLYGDCRRGRRPDFTGAGSPAEARQLYEQFVENLKAPGISNVQTGVFGADMAIDMVADGPVTLILDSEQMKTPRRKGSGT